MFFQDLGLGEYCCPDKVANGTSTCCDTNPNPTPPPPKTITAGAPIQLLCPSVAAALLLAAVLGRF